MTKYEYKIIEYVSNFEEAGLNKYGSEGWELVTQIVLVGCYSTYTFKRALNDDKI